MGDLSRSGTTPADTRRSRAWYLAPILFTIIGGVIAYLVLKDDDPQLAKRCVILGFVIIVVEIIIYYLWIGLLLGSMLMI